MAFRPKTLSQDERWRLPALARFGAELRNVEGIGTNQASGVLSHLVAPGVRYADAREADPSQRAAVDGQ
jgi:hypothetical protein